MRVEHAERYGTPCIVVDAGDDPDKVLAAAREAGAVYHDEDAYVVQLAHRDVGPELFTEAALRRALTPKKKKVW